jgi:hypothetical protein
MAYQSFEDLEVWQRGCRLSIAIFEAFEKCKRFTLRDEIERAGLSIPLGKSSFDSLVRESREISAMLQGLRMSVLKKSAAKQKRARRKRLKLNT